MIERCSWSKKSLLEIEYHDQEWGIPTYDDSILFEALILESMQAGLSWSTILNKRENMREAFDGFDYKIIATYNHEKIEDLLNNKGIIRHRKKLQALVSNAQAFMKVQSDYGSFSQFIWSYVDGTPIIQQNQAQEGYNSLSKQISKELKEKGFKFLGPTTVYAFMQAVGMINDHELTCSFKER